MTTKHKFVRVIDGLYRTETGGYTIMRNHDEPRSRLRWKLVFTNFFGEKVTRKFFTLASAKAYVNDPGRY